MVGLFVTMSICQRYVTMLPHATHWSHMTFSCSGILVGTHVGFALRYSGASRTRFTFRITGTNLLDAYIHSRVFSGLLLPYRDYVQVGCPVTRMSTLLYLYCAALVAYSSLT